MKYGPGKYLLGAAALAALCYGAGRLGPAWAVLVPALGAAAAGLAWAAAENRRRRAEEAKNAAESANLAKSEFLANVSHEIRTPMTAILGFTEVLVEDGELHAAPPPRLAAIQTIKRNAEHLLEVLNEVLDLSKIEAGKLEVERLRCSPVQLVSDVVSLMQVHAQAKGLPLQVEYEGPVPETIQTDPTRLQQILLNLLNNAIKFTAVGSVRLQVRLAERYATDARMEICVLDTGIGMTAAQVGRLFQPFSQADASMTRKFGGTGLGLAISKRLAGMLGGDLVVSSQAGSGSCFTVSIQVGSLAGVRLIAPATAAPPAANAPSQTVTPIPPLAGRILLAEDGPDNQRLFSFHLRKAGADVTLAENGQVALDLVVEASAEGKPFQLILMDMQMPVLDGYEATRLLRERGYAGPIVALTAHAMKQDQEKCSAAGCDGYLSKPIERRRLIEAVACYLESGAGDSEKARARAATGAAA